MKIHNLLFFPVGIIASFFSLFADVEPLTQSSSEEKYPHVDVASVSSTEEEEESVEYCVSGFSASAIYDIEDPFCIFLTADFIYWQAREDNLDYGVTTKASNTSPILNGTVLNMEFDWHAGLKVGVGTDFRGHDCWDMFLEWTYLNSHNNSVTNAPSGVTIFPSLLQPSLIADLTAQTAKANWKLIYNTLDFNIGRPFYSGELMTIRPHAGLRGAWFRQRYNAAYLDGALTFTSNTKFDSWSLGPRFGFDTNWELPGGFKLFGNAAFSLVFTAFNVNKFETNASMPSSVMDKRHHNQIRANAEALIGFGWSSYFDCERWHADVDLGYEFQYWPDANGDIRFVDFMASGVHVTGGNLVLHGVTFRARFDF